MPPNQPLEQTSPRSALRRRSSASRAAQVAHTKWVIVVGCSHPGIEEIVEAATKINPHIHFIAGGFHLVVAKDDEIEKVVNALRDTYNVAYVAPGHCTGEPAFTALEKAFGANYLYAGLGTTIAFGTTPRAIGGALEHPAIANPMRMLAAFERRTHSDVIGTDQTSNRHRRYFTLLPVQHVGEHQRRDDGRIGFDDEARGIH